MHLKLITAPAEEVLSIDEVATHLRVDGLTVSPPSDEYNLIVSLMKSARLYLEGKDGILGRALVTQTWDMYLDEFPDCGCIEVPLPPLQSITSIYYTDTAGTEQLLDASMYVVDNVTEPARIRPAYGQVWPLTRCQMNAVRIRLIAGYGNAIAVKEPIKQAMKLIIGHWYEHREEVIVGNQMMTVPMAVDALCAPYRIQPV